MTNDNDVYTPAQYREHQEGHGHRESDEHTHTGIVRDPLVSRFLSIQAENYDPREADEPGEMPGQARDLGETEEIRALAATETGRAALENGDMPSLKHLTGDQNQQADISGIKAIEKVDEIIKSPAPVIVILGDMGSGKTDFAGLIGQRAKHLLGIKKVASNIPSLRNTDKWNPDPDVTIEDGRPVDQDGEPVAAEVRDGFVPDFPTLEQWVKQDGKPRGDQDQLRKLFIGDEFSSVGSGVGKSGYQVRTKMGPLVFKIRKFGGMLIYIAHDASSIHPLLWRLGKIIKKESKKEAVIADRISNGEIRDIEDRIEGIPQTDWVFDTQDPAVWSWGDESDQEDGPDPGTVAWDTCCYTAIQSGEESGISTRDAADFMPYGYRWIAERRREYEQENKHQDLIHRVEEWTA